MLRISPDQDLKSDVKSALYVEYLNGEYAKKLKLSVKVEWVLILHLGTN